MIRGVADVIITSVGFEARAASDRAGDRDVGASLRTACGRDEIITSVGFEARAASDASLRDATIVTSVGFEARAASGRAGDRDVGASLRTARHSLPPMQRRHGVVRMRVAMPG